MKLIIAEKPSVAKAIYTVLGANEKKKGYMEGGAIMCHGVMDTWLDCTVLTTTVETGRMRGAFHSCL